ncbi:hypothetical protein EDB86DRAFT_2831007 [Lactarius hatsudake]|nr:hypothetical protein EDB86DRAFT_2831007 [Lactarius hatsudake]
MVWVYSPINRTVWVDRRICNGTYYCKTTTKPTASPSPPAVVASPPVCPVVTVIITVVAVAVVVGVPPSLRLGPALVQRRRLVAYSARGWRSFVVVVVQRMWRWWGLPSMLQQNSTYRLSIPPQRRQSRMRYQPPLPPLGPFYHKQQDDVNDDNVATSDNNNNNNVTRQLGWLPTAAAARARHRQQQDDDDDEDKDDNGVTTQQYKIRQ